MKRGAERYLRNYKMVTIVDEKGREKRDLIYIGSYYVDALPARHTLTRKIIYPAFSVIQIILLGLGLTRHIIANQTGILAALSMLLMFPCFFSLLAAIRIAIRKRKIEAPAYRGSTMMMKISSFTGVIVSLSVAIGYWVFHVPHYKEAAVFLNACFYSLMCVLFFVCLMLSLREKFTVITANQVQTHLHDAIETIEEEHMEA